MNPAPSPATAGSDGHTTGGDRRVYGLVEWDGTYRPTVIVGCCWPAVLRDIIATITGWVAAGGQFDSDDFPQRHPIPDPNAPAEVLADWLDALHTEATVPYVTPMEPADLVHTGDPLIVVDRLAANPCYSRPAIADRTPTRDRPISGCHAGRPAAVRQRLPSGLRGRRRRGHHQLDRHLPAHRTPARRGNGTG